MVLRNNRTTGDGGGSGTTAGQAKILNNLMSSSGFNSGKTVGQAVRALTIGNSGGGSSGGGYVAPSGGGSGGGSTRSSSGGGAASSSRWGCPSGATLIHEPGGTGNLVCRWNHNGALFAAVPQGSAAPTPAAPAAPAPGTAAPVAGPSTVAAPAETADYLQVAKDIFAADPQAMLADDLMQKYGANTNNQLYDLLAPYADAANAVFLGQRGLNAADGTGDDFLAWLGNYWDALQTPGQRIDYRTARQNIFANPGDNPLGAYLTTGDPADQAGNTMRLLSANVDGQYNNLVSNAIMKQLDMARQRYIGESARNPEVGNFIAYLQKNNPDLVSQLLA